MISGDSVRVAQPLFQVEGQGSIPMSPLQFEIEEISKKQFSMLNKLWHSRLPLSNCYNGTCYAAIFNNIIFAVAWWSKPIAHNRLNFGNHILASEAASFDAIRSLHIFVNLQSTCLPLRYVFLFLLLCTLDNAKRFSTLHLIWL